MKRAANWPVDARALVAGLARRAAPPLTRSRHLGASGADEVLPCACTRVRRGRELASRRGDVEVELLEGGGGGGWRVRRSVAHERTQRCRLLYCAWRVEARNLRGLSLVGVGARVIEVELLLMPMVARRASPKGHEVMPEPVARVGGVPLLAPELLHEVVVPIKAEVAHHAVNVRGPLAVDMLRAAAPARLARRCPGEDDALPRQRGERVQ